MDCYRQLVVLLYINTLEVEPDILNYIHSLGALTEEYPRAVHVNEVFAISLLFHKIGRSV